MNASTPIVGLRLERGAREILHGHWKGTLMENDPNAIRRIELTSIYYAIAAIEAAVNGADFNDTAEQRGIVHLLSEQNGKLLEILNEMGGKAGFTNED